MQAWVLHLGHCFGTSDAVPVRRSCGEDADNCFRHQHPSKEKADQKKEGNGRKLTIWALAGVWAGPAVERISMFATVGARVAHGLYVAIRAGGATAVRPTGADTAKRQIQR